MKGYTLFHAAIKMRNALYRLKDEPLLEDERYQIAQEALRLLENHCEEWIGQYPAYCLGTEALRRADELGAG